MNIQEKLRKTLTIHQMMEGDKWIPVNLLGQPVDKSEADHVEFLACAECGKRYKWNQQAWMEKHTQEHETESAEAAKAAEQAQAEQAQAETADYAGCEQLTREELVAIKDRLWHTLDMLERVLSSDEWDRRKVS